MKTLTNMKTMTATPHQMKQKYAVISRQPDKVKHMVAEYAGETYCGFPYNKTELYQEDKVEHLDVCDNCRRTSAYKQSLYAYNGVYPVEEVYRWLEKTLPKKPGKEECTRESEQKEQALPVRFIDKPREETSNCIHLYTPGMDESLCELMIEERTDDFAPLDSLPVCAECLSQAGEEAAAVYKDRPTMPESKQKWIPLDDIEEEPELVHPVQFRSYTDREEENCIHLFTGDRRNATICNKNIIPKDILDPDEELPVCQDCIKWAEINGLNIGKYKTHPRVRADETTVVVADGPPLEKDDKPEDTEESEVLITDDMMVHNIGVYVSNDTTFGYRLKTPVTLKEIMRQFPKNENKT